MQIRGVSFDMDGVIVDNHKYHFMAWMEFAYKYNYKLTSEIYRDKFNGKTNKDLFPMIFGPLTDEQIEAFSKEKEDLYKKLYIPHMAPLKGLVEYLNHLQKEGIKIALGTSAPPSNVEFVLDRLDLRKFFSIIVDGTHVTKGKPDPQVYELCAKKMGLLPSECIVFEDSLAGLESGKRAGCVIVGVATSHKKEELSGMTDKMISDFTEARELLGH